MDDVLNTVKEGLFLIPMYKLLLPLCVAMLVFCYVKPYSRFWRKVERVTSFAFWLTVCYVLVCGYLCL